MSRKLIKITLLFSIAVVAFISIWDLEESIAEENIEISLPINCKVGLNCWIVNYVDHDPTNNAKDFRCGRLTYDGHKGTDFAIRNIKDMNRGVAVLAAASGNVIAIRDGMQDASITKGDTRSVKGKECGNGVLIKHTGGWSTQYCHLRNGSIQVSKGQEIFTGDNIGFVGLSGKTEFPHVHFALRLNGKIVDPFVGIQKPLDCAESSHSNWSIESRSKLNYNPPYVYSTGFSPAVPKVQAIRRGARNIKLLPTRSPVIVFWADVFAVNVGDELVMNLKGPKGQKLASRKITFEKYQARYFVFIGKKRKKTFWPSGIYTGEITIRRSRLKTSNPTKTVIDRLTVKQINE